MKNNPIAIFLLLNVALGIPQIQAQVFKNIGKKLEKHAEQAIEELSLAKTAANSSKATSTQTTPFKNITTKSHEYVKGNSIIFKDNFQEDNIGEMAPKWVTNGVGNVVEIAGVPGRWLQLHNMNTYKIKDLYKLPEVYTVEFDVLPLVETKNNLQLSFGFDYQKGIDKHYFLPQQNPINIKTSFRFNNLAFVSNELQTKKESQIEGNLSAFVNDIMKVRIMVKQDIMKVFVDDYKVLDTEMVNPSARKYIYFSLDNEQDQGKIYISNISITSP